MEGRRTLGEVGDVRLGSLKYEWLGPLMLQRASEVRQLGYGGEQTADRDLLYAERGHALAFLVSWAEEAKALAQELGYTH